MSRPLSVLHTWRIMPLVRTRSHVALVIMSDCKYTSSFGKHPHASSFYIFFVRFFSFFLPFFLSFFFGSCTRSEASQFRVHTFAVPIRTNSHGTSIVASRSKSARFFLLSSPFLFYIRPGYVWDKWSRLDGFLLQVCLFILAQSRGGSPLSRGLQIRFVFTILWKQTTRSMAVIAGD